jgi:3',5'-cyclic AMP phosphodiesterase CpdA
LLGDFFLGNWFTGLFCMPPTAFVIFESVDRFATLPKTVGVWLLFGILGPLFLFGFFAALSIHSHASPRLPGRRISLLVLGSLPGPLAERIVRGVLALSAAVVAIAIIVFLLAIGPFLQAHPFLPEADARNNVLGGIGMLIALPSGPWFLGLLWLTLSGCLRVVGSMLGSGFLMQPRVQTLPTEFRSPAKASVHIAHISDCHVTATPDTRTLQGGGGGYQPLSALLPVRHKELIAADVIIVTGDAVDSGHTKEWGQFFELMTRQGLSDRLFLVPGNHELNIADAGSRMRTMGDERLVFRKLRFLGALRDTRSARASAFDPGGGVQTVETLINRHIGTLERACATIDDPLLSPLLYTSTVPPGYFETQKLINDIWDVVFPYWHILDDGVVLVVLDSNARSNTLVTNGFGEVSPTQLEKLKKIGQMFPDDRLVIAMHHHPLDPPGWASRSGRGTPLPLKGRRGVARADLAHKILVAAYHMLKGSLDERLCSLTNARDFFGTLASACAHDPVILNGHRHLDVASRVVIPATHASNAVTVCVCAAPSTNYGRDETGPGFYIVGVGGHRSDASLTCRTWCGISDAGTEGPLEILPATGMPLEQPCISPAPDPFQRVEGYA